MTDDEIRQLVRAKLADGALPRQIQGGSRGTWTWRLINRYGLW